MPNDQNAPDFWNRVAQRYAAMSMRNPVAYEATLDRVRAHLGPQDRVLEIGCGTGTTALRLAPCVAHYTATDYASAMIDIAREKQAAADVGNLDFRTARPGDGSLHGGPFDAILAFNVLHLLPDRAAALGDILRQLRPGGLFISKTPCLGGAYRILQPAVAALHLIGKAPKLAFLTPLLLDRAVSDAGFDIRERATLPARPPGRFIVAQKAE
jgi:SAM-dependent methyltransferase